MPKITKRKVRLFFRPFVRFFLIDLFADNEARPVLIYAMVLITVGALLFHWVEGWGWLDSVYFTVVTITTIGFGDFSPKTDMGKIITIFYGLNGVALLLMLFDQIRRIRAKELKENNAPIVSGISQEIDTDKS